MRVLAGNTYEAGDPRRTRVFRGHHRAGWFGEVREGVYGSEQITVKCITFDQYATSEKFARVCYADYGWIMGFRLLTVNYRFFAKR